MTTQQIYALIILTLLTAAIYWTGYRFGKIDGRADGEEYGKNTERYDNAGRIRALRDLLDHEKRKHRELFQHYLRAVANCTFGEKDRQTLLSIAEKLKLAADTFRAMSSKNQAQQALELREEALSMAALLEPITPERAA